MEGKVLTHPGIHMGTSWVLPISNLVYKEIQPKTDAVQTCSFLHETTKTLLPEAGSTHSIRPGCTEGLAESSKNVLTKNNKEPEHLMTEAGQELAAYINEEFIKWPAILVYSVIVTASARTHTNTHSNTLLLQMFIHFKTSMHFKMGKGTH